jgi:hypothetical protein
MYLFWEVVVRFLNVAFYYLSLFIIHSQTFWKINNDFAGRFEAFAKLI